VVALGFSLGQRSAPPELVFAGVQRRADVQEPASRFATTALRAGDRAPQWVLVDPAALILGQTPDGLARLAARTRRKRGVAILPEPALTRGEATAAVLFDGRRIETAPIVWTVGVAPNPLTAQLRLPHDERGRVPVDETLRVPDVPHVSARGDGAADPGEATPGATNPATCRHVSVTSAEQGATCAARRTPTVAARELRRLRLVAGTASCWRPACAPAASPAGSSHGAPTGCSCRSRRVAHAWRRTGPTRRSFRDDVAELTVVGPGRSRD
jgi:hypothetical protein